MFERGLQPVERSAGKERRNVVILSSGGLDSTTLAFWLRAQSVPYVPLFFDYGQHCVEKEWATLNAVLTEGPRPCRIDVSGIFKGSTSRLISEPNLWAEPVEPRELYIPYRTMLFLTAAAAFAQTNNMTDVYSGFINSNHAKELDCTSEFLNALEALSESVGAVRFHIPFRTMAKREVAELAAKLGVPIGSTYSCQVFSDVPCGACPNCVDRLDGLREAALLQENGH